jgi:hypothetical protein
MTWRRSSGSFLRRARTLVVPVAGGTSWIVWIVLMSFRRRFLVSRRAGLLFLALAGATLMLAACQVERNPTEFAGCQTTLCCEECELLAVARVIDGDTFDSPAGRVRLFGVDTPERGERCYDEASRRLRSLAGASVRVQSGPRDRDPNGRLLYYVYTAMSIRPTARALTKSWCGRAWPWPGPGMASIVTCC